jgi:3-hydroxyacyl-[acyl-carrier-protein] dehydratase
MSERCDASICIPKDHPALPGHFPGIPIVPGVVVLDQVLRAAEARLGRPLRIAGLSHVKFLSPLPPEQPARCTFEIEGARLAFRVELAGQLIAGGAFVLGEGRTG